MTEQEAKTKWCPFARYVIDGGSTGYPSGNRWDNGDKSATGSMAEKSCRCLGSACAVWRWEVEDPATYESAPGFCGLAWRPLAIPHRAGKP